MCAERVNATLTRFMELKGQIMDPKKSIYDICQWDDRGLSSYSRDLESRFKNNSLKDRLNFPQKECEDALLLAKCNLYFTGIHSQITRSLLKSDEYGHEETLQRIRKLLEEHVLDERAIELNLEIIGY